MIRIILGLVVIFMCTYFGYRYITGLDVEKLENIFDNKLPVIAWCVAVTMVIVTFIIVVF